MFQHFPTFSRTSLFLLLSLIAMVPLYGQDALSPNQRVTVLPFSLSFEGEEDVANYPKMLAEVVQSALGQTKRFIVLERMNLDLATEEIDRIFNSEQSAYFNRSSQDLIQVGKLLDAKYIFTGNISNVATAINTGGLYVAEFGFTIKAFSVETGKVYITETFNISSGKSGLKLIAGETSKREALNKALQNTVVPIQEFIDKYFPLEAHFKRVHKATKGGDILEIVIDRGFSSGLRTKQKLNLWLPETEATQLSLVGMGKIGSVKIIELESNSAICRIMEGRAALRAAIEISGKAATEHILLRSTID